MVLFCFILIIFITGSQFSSFYGASKGAINCFIESVRRENAEDDRKVLLFIIVIIVV
jgi:short-subunit dehydrogenase